MKTESVKINCPSCNQRIIITRDTESCPKCSMQFNPKVVQDMFDKLDSIEGKTQSIQNVSKGVQETGKAVNDIGCALMMIPIAIIALVILFSLLG